MERAAGRLVDCKASGGSPYYISGVVAKAPSESQKRENGETSMLNTVFVEV